MRACIYTVINLKLNKRSQPVRSLVYLFREV